MSGIDALIAADRVVMAGLKAYDLAISRLAEPELAKIQAKMTKLGHSAEEFEAYAAERRAGFRQARAKLHRELWLKAIGALVDSGDLAVEA